MLFVWTKNTPSYFPVVIKGLTGWPKFLAIFMHLQNSRKTEQFFSETSQSQACWNGPNYPGAWRIVPNIWDPSAQHYAQWGQGRSMLRVRLALLLPAPKPADEARKMSSCSRPPPPPSSPFRDHMGGARLRAGSWAAPALEAMQPEAVTAEGDGGELGGAPPQSRTAPPTVRERGLVLVPLASSFLLILDFSTSPCCPRSFWVQIWSLFPGCFEARKHHRTGRVWVFFFSVPSRFQRILGKLLLREHGDVKIVLPEVTQDMMC